uniref:T-cell surface glycoprotein CD8 alpha chain-like n=1 Tax=Poecilia reticulata TaxID=8081 RepID=A0A3P9Q9D8_POERE
YKFCCFYFFVHVKIHSAVKTVEEGQSEKVKCTLPAKGTIVFWFRVVEDQGMEFIGSFANTGAEKATGPNYKKNLIVDKQSDDFVLTVKSFNKKSDSGMYTCAVLVSGNTLSFGQVTQLQGKLCFISPLATFLIQVSTTRQTTTTPTSCGKTSIYLAGPSLFCAPIILGPLAGGCGLLLLLLIISILYCNKIRTRRCPHHYKRK